MEHNLDIVDKLYAELLLLRPLKPEDQIRLDKKFRLEFNYNSNHIEGNTLTYGETELLLIFDDTRGNHSMREYEETKAHDIAYQMIEALAKDDERPLNEQIIKNLNEIILVRPFWKEAITPDGQNTRRQIQVGNYKEFPNSVRLKNGEIFHYASPLETPALMEELVSWYRSEETAVHPVTLAAMLHYKFVRIHPFDDGNGRISRLLMNYVLLKFDYPPVIIKSSDKDNYLRVLHIADIGDYAPLISYVAEQVSWSLQTSIRAAKGESLEDKDDFIKEIELIRRKASSKSIPKSPKITYNTFKLIDKKLWPPLLKTLAHFDGLFNETKNAYTVNDYTERFEKYVLSLNDFISAENRKATEDPKALKIFGYDVYEYDTRKINWEHIMYALRGPDIPVNLKTALAIKFDNYNYTISLSIDTLEKYNVKKPYEDDLLDEEIDEINNTLKNDLFELIDKSINK